MTRRFIAALALAAAVAGFAPSPASAGSIVFCRPASPGVAAGPGRFTAPGSGNAYSLDRAGCTVGLVTDAGDFQANGFVQVGNARALVVTGITAAVSMRISSAETSASSGSRPESRMRPMIRCMLCST